MIYSNEITAKLFECDIIQLFTVQYPRSFFRSILLLPTLGQSYAIDTQLISRPLHIDSVIDGLITDMAWDKSFDGAVRGEASTAHITCLY